MAVAHENNKIGFIVMDGIETLFGTLSGNTREVLHKYSVFPRGGRRAARLRLKNSYIYVAETAELATKFFINPATSQLNVTGLIFAGSVRVRTYMFDIRLQTKIVDVVDVLYGGENGFNQAIELSAEILSNVKLILERRLIEKFFEEINQGTGEYVFGVDDTLKVLEMGLVEILIVWENLDVMRYVLKNSSTGEIFIKHLNKDQEADESNFRDSATNAELEVEDKMPLPEWFANEYRGSAYQKKKKEYRGSGCTLEFVTNNSEEGSQFCREYGGIGGILVHRMWPEMGSGEWVVQRRRPEMGSERVVQRRRPEMGSERVVQRRRPEMGSERVVQRRCPETGSERVAYGCPKDISLEWID